MCAAFAVVVAGCSGGDNDAASATDTSPHDERSRATSIPSTTQPPGTDPTAVRPIFEDLLAREDDILARLLGDPDQALDPDAPILDELAEILTAEEYEWRIDDVRQNAENQLVFEPLGPEPMWVTTIVSDLAPVDANHVEAYVCTVYHSKSHSPTGGGDIRRGAALVGIARAERVDGRWVLGPSEEDDTQGCDPSQKVLAP